MRNSILKPRLIIKTTRMSPSTRLFFILFYYIYFNLSLSNTPLNYENVLILGYKQTFITETDSSVKKYHQIYGKTKENEYKRNHIFSSVKRKIRNIIITNGKLKSFILYITENVLDCITRYLYKKISVSKARSLRQQTRCFWSRRLVRLQYCWLKINP